MHTKHNRPAKAGKHLKQPGSSPGSLVFTGERLQDSVSLQLTQFTETSLRTFTETAVDALLGRLDPQQVNWISVSGLHDTAVVEALGSRFGIDPLVLEDILHTGHMPKIEEHDTYVFLTLKMLNMCADGSIEHEQISLLLGDWWLVTFQEKESPVFEVIRELLAAGTGRLRKRRADYLFYRLLDTIVDHYFVILDGMEDNLSQIEEAVLEQNGANISGKILAARKNMLSLRRTVLPLHESMRLLAQHDVALISEGTWGFLDDVRDHLAHMGQAVEHARDMVSGLMDLHMTLNANKMNNVMKTLTVFASIFMPLTFLSGVYGMNFEFIPELGWRWGYPLVLGVMAITAGGMLLYMRRKKWL
ncbi:MAG: magnesium/cobalt transporter CorA [Deltaproteobacteria bacterium]|nr:magnesium/cobalt transporter CorA [Deltaproteobacteria bacterium]